MSDNAQSSTVTLLKPSIDSPKYPATSNPRNNSEKSSGDSFSRELTRVADRAEAKRHESARPAKERVEHSEQGQTSKARQLRNVDQTAASGPATGKPERAQRSANSSLKETTSESDNTGPHPHRPELPVHGNENNTTAVDNPGPENEGSARDLASVLHSIDANGLESANHQFPSQSSSLLAAQGDVQSELSASIDATSETSDAVVPGTVVSDIVVSGTDESGSGEVNTGLSAVQLRLEKSTVQYEVARMPGAVSGAIGSGMMTAGVNADADNTPVLPGEQISPAGLASRQAHLVGQSVLRQGHTVAAVHDANMANDPDKEIEPLRVSVGNVSTLESSTLKTAQSSDDPTRHMLSSSPPLSRPSLEPRTTSIQNVAENLVTDEDIRTADLKAAAEIDAKQVARINEQQVTQTNLAQAQLQARQQVARAFINPAIKLAARDTVEPGILNADNLFLSSSGGIVTAPVLQRADTGPTQTITAPLNMPVLQGDAEKAMAGNIRWMVNEGVKNAVVHVTPSGMGPISVRVGKEKDHIKVSIVASQGATREALDSMLPRLREQLAAQGHDSVRVDISDGRSGQSDRGYAQQESAQRQAMGDQSGSSNSSTETTLEELMAEKPVEGVTRITQDLITTDSNGQVRSRYDVYV